jgi:hypothetical protein
MGWANGFGPGPGIVPAAGPAGVASWLHPGTGVCVEPVAGEQASTVQGSPSSSWTAVSGVPRQVPDALQASPVVQAFPSEQGCEFVGVCVTTPVAALHESWVQGLPSSTGVGVPTHTPDALQASLVVQAFPSEHAVPADTGTCVTTPVAGLQESAVHGLPSSICAAEIGVPAHAPEALHVSPVVQAFPSEHWLPVAGA